MFLGLVSCLDTRAGSTGGVDSLLVVVMLLGQVVTLVGVRERGPVTPSVATPLRDVAAIIGRND